MPTRYRTPTRLINDLFESHPNAIHEGVLEPGSERLSFMARLWGIDRQGHIERRLGTGAIKDLTVGITLIEGGFDSYSHSVSYYNVSKSQWAKRDFFGLENMIEDPQAGKIDAVEFPCGKDDIDLLTDVLRRAQIITSVPEAKQTHQLTPPIK